MSFDLDDPLADILSDGSDDSFFNDDILGKKKSAKSTPVLQRQNSLFDLENSKPTASLKKTSSFDEPGQPGKKVDLSPKSQFKPVKKDNSIVSAIDATSSRKKSTSEDTFDLLDETPQQTRNIQKGKSSHSLFDDILGVTSRPSTSVTNKSKPKHDKDESKDTNDTEVKKQIFNDIFENKKEKNLPIKPPKTADPLAKQKSVEFAPPRTAPSRVDPQITIKPPVQKQDSVSKESDWLGIFKENDVDDSETNMPSWLIGKDTAIEKSKVKSKSEKMNTVSEKVQNDEINDEARKVETSSAAAVVKEKLEQIPMPQSVLQTSNFTNSDVLAQEGALLLIQQQESQLQLALKLKEQEERLTAIERQKEESKKLNREMRVAQSDQMSSLLQRQAEHRLQMQSLISAHQQRINDRIKALLTSNNENEVSEDEKMKNGDRVLPTSDSPRSKEKKQLLQLVESLQENHDKEIDLMESSYRRQLAFLEVSMNQTEDRMKEESDKLMKYYAEKIQWLEEHYQTYKSIVEDKIKDMRATHNNELEEARNQHIENIKALQDRHKELIENIKNATRQEHKLLEDSASFATSFSQLLSELKDNKVKCVELVKIIQDMQEKNIKEVVSDREQRDQVINDMLRHLHKDKENFETEKTEMRESIKALESRLKQMTQALEDESNALKQKKIEFEFERATFNKQTEFAKNVLKKQEEEIKTIKDDLQKDYNERQVKSQEERKQIEKDIAITAKEKAAIQNIRQELDRMRAELQSQLEESMEERSRMNVEKQQMQVEHQRILAKSREIEMLSKTAIERQAQADHKYSEAELLQRKYEEKINKIQEHIISLNDRERQIAREKVALSKERLNLHNEKKQLESRMQCSLCKSMPAKTEFENFASYTVERQTQGSLGVTRDYNTGIDIPDDIALRHTILQQGTAGINDTATNTVVDPETYKEFVDPKLLLLKLDVQQVLNNLRYSSGGNNDENNVPDG